MVLKKSRPKRETKQRDYAKLKFTTSYEDILDVTDPLSNQFDEEMEKYLSKKIYRRS